MGLTLLAQKCKMGNTEYYLTKIKASTLIQNVGYASEMPNWPDMSIDERMQREIKGERVASDIVPYIISDPDWFFGALIVDIYSGWEGVKYQPIKEIVDVKSAAYDETLNEAGFLTLPDNKVLIALDGQHRLAALNMAIRGRNGVPGSVKLSETVLNGLEAHLELADADISVIFVEHKNDNNKIRKIFNKVNRYAKQTSKSDNIITSEDDVIAVVSRKMFNGENAPLKKINNVEIVNWTSNTIPLRSKQLTTLSALYTITEAILSHYDITAKSASSDENVSEAQEIMKNFWNLSMEGITVFKDYISYVKNGKPLENLRKANLLLKPVTHMAYAQAVYTVLEMGFEYKNVIEKFNRIDWSYDNPVWINVLITNSASRNMITGGQAIRNAGKIIAYMIIGESYSKKEKEELLNILRDAADDNTVELPQIIK